MSFIVTDGRSGVIPARFDEAAFDRERERIAAAQTTLAEARELVEQLDDEQREAIAADIAERRARPALAAPREWRRDPSRGLADDVSPPPGAYERALEETIQRRIDADRETDRAFPIETIGSALAAMMEAVEAMDKRLDALEYDNLQLRGLLHENGLAIRSLLPDPADDFAPRTPRVLARAGSRTLTERAANRSYPSSDAAPWFGQPYFTADDD